MKRRLPGAWLFSMLSVVAQAQVAGPGLDEALASGGHVSVVVALRPPATPLAAFAAHVTEVRALQARVLSRLSADEFMPTSHWRAVSGLAGELTRAGLSRLLEDPEVVRVDLDVPGSGGTAVSGPLIHADIAQGLGWTGKGVTVAVLDSGVDASHPDLANDVVAEQCFCTNSDGTGCCPNGEAEQSGPGAAPDEFGHGTNVTGIITSNGRFAPLGIAPEARVVAVRVLDHDNRFAGSAQVVSGLDWVLTERRDVRIVNMSLGTSARFTGYCDDRTAFTLAFAQVINALRSQGIAVFAISGNDGSPTSMQAPGCVRGTVSVGAVYKANVGPVTILGCQDRTTAADAITCFSNSDTTLDLLAPGAPITSTGVGGRISTYYGTSQASPHAAAAAAILLQADPALTPDQIEALLKLTGIPVTDGRNGLTVPRIDVGSALVEVLLSRHTRP